MKPAPGAPTPPIEIAGGSAGAEGHLAAPRVDIPDDVLDELRSSGADVITDAAELGESGRDWWPLAMVWATAGQVGARPFAVARPTSTEQVSALLATCDRARIPVTAAGGRSSVVGGAVPVHGGLVLDLRGLSGIVSVDRVSLVVEVLAGTFGDAFEAELAASHEITVGHWPQSMALSTVGGWIACRGAGQLSNRYGKIEDIVVGLEVVLADGRVIRTGGQPRQAVGPDLNQLFVGSEGTLGVITRAWLQAHPAPAHRRRAAYGFASFAEGLDAMRRITQRHASPAVMRLYDEVESIRNHGTEAGVHVLLVLDEGDGTMVDAGMEVVAEECEYALRLGDHLVDHWMEKRNDVAALEALISRGYVVDTMEVAGPWSALPGAFETVIGQMQAVPGTLAVSAHQSHSYQTGGCLYFTFAGQVEPDARDTYYTAAWDTGTRAALAAGCALSHHHGVGINRARFVAEALGPALDVLVAMKAALDPNGILNPGKLGLPDPFGAVEWPDPPGVTLDAGVVARGAGYALCWLVPAAALNILASESESGVLVFATFLLILLGFAFGGYAVARNPVTNPLQHAAAAAFAAYAVVQVVGVLVAIGRDRDINPVGILFTALLAACTGMLGAVLALRRPA